MTKPSEQPETIDASLLALGVDKTPTLEMVAKGKVGSGQRLSLADETAKTIQTERRSLQRQLKIGRVEAYEQGVKDSLEKIVGFEKDLLDLGVTLMEKLERGKSLTMAESQTLKLAASTAAEMKNRVLRKPTQEIQHNVSILGLLAGTVMPEQLDES
jgi:hypothetical protein